MRKIVAILVFFNSVHDFPCTVTKIRQKTGSRHTCTQYSQPAAYIPMMSVKLCINAAFSLRTYYIAHKIMEIHFKIRIPLVYVDRHV